MSIVIKRIYETPEDSDGFRVLVDRLWPRGVSKEKAELDLWLKDAAPSTELRTWFNHEPERFEEFKTRYEIELGKNPVIEEMLELAKQNKKLTLLYAARDSRINHAVVLLRFLQKRLS